MRDLLLALNVFLVVVIETKEFEFTLQKPCFANRKTGEEQQQEAHEDTKPKTLTCMVRVSEVVTKRVRSCTFLLWIVLLTFCSFISGPYFGLVSQITSATIAAAISVKRHLVTVTQTNTSLEHLEPVV